MIRIAAIGSEQATGLMKACAEEMADLEVMPFVYQHPSESIGLVDRIIGCDVILFAGPLPYFLSKSKLGRRLPAVYMPSDDYTLMATLFHCMVHYPDASRLSIDLYTEKAAFRVANEIGLDPSSWHLMESGKKISEGLGSFDPEQIFQFHKTLHEQGKADLALTSVDFVHDLLKKEGIPSLPLIVPEKAVADTLLRAKTLGELAISKQAEMAIGLIVFNTSESLDGNFANLYADAAHVLQERLSELARQSEMSIRLIGMDQFILYGTRGSVEQLTDPRILNPFFNQLNAFRMTASIGLGFGVTAKEAETNAQCALQQAKKDSGRDTVYVATGEKEVTGPINADGQSRTFLLKTQDDLILKIAEKTSSSVSTVSKLLHFSKARHSAGFTAADLSEYLGTSRRSTERLVKKFIDQGFAEKVGEEQPYQQGRPRAVYRLAIR